MVSQGVCQGRYFIRAATYVERGCAVRACMRACQRSTLQQLPLVHFRTWPRQPPLVVALSRCTPDRSPGGSWETDTSSQTLSKINSEEIAKSNTPSACRSPSSPKSTEPSAGENVCPRTSTARRASRNLCAREESKTPRKTPSTSPSHRRVCPPWHVEALNLPKKKPRENRRLC